MANISVYHRNILSSAPTISGTLIDDQSSIIYAVDNRVSFDCASSANTCQLHAVQSASDIQPWQHLVIARHTNLAGGTAIVEASTQANRSDRQVVISGTIPSADPGVLTAGTERTGDIYLDITLQGSGVSIPSFGEAMLVRQFDSPQRPGIGIDTRYIPRRSFMDMPNGEKQSIRHGGVCKKKTYTIGGMTLAEAAEWVELFEANEGSELVALVDETGDTWVAYMQPELTVNDQTGITTIQLEFTQVNLD